MNIKKILLTEKSNLLQKKQNVYSFLVSPDMNKHQIKKKIIDLFPNIKIEKIRTSLKKPVLQKHRYTKKLPGKHYTGLIKKAYVQLALNSVPLRVEEIEEKK